MATLHAVIYFHLLVIMSTRTQASFPNPPVESEGGSAAAPSPQVLLILLESVNSTVEPFLNTSKSKKQFDLYGCPLTLTLYGTFF